MSTRYRARILNDFYKGTPKYLYLGAVLRNLGYSLLGGFGTIYIYKLFLDYGFSERVAFALTLLRAALLYLLVLFLLFPVAKLVKKAGAKTLITIGPILSAISMIFWALAQNSLWWLVLSVFIGAILITVYWIPFHTVFSVRNQEKTLGRQMGILSIISSGISVVTPLAAGIVIESFGGFNVLFAMSFFIFSSASVAFSLMKIDLQVKEFPIRDFSQAYKKERRLFPDYLVIGAENLIQDIVWSVFVFLFIKSFLKLGILASAISLALAVFSYFVGKLSDEKKVGGLDKLGALFNGIIWFGKLFAQTGLHVFFLDSLFGLFRTSYSVPIDVIIYADAKHDNPMWPVVVREVALNIGRVVTAVVAAIVIYLGYDYWTIFLMASVMYLLLGFFLKDNVSPKATHV